MDETTQGTQDTGTKTRHPIYQKLGALVALHQPEKQTTKGFTEDPWEEHLGCTACEDHVRWPCPTSLALTELVAELQKAMRRKTDWGVRYGPENKGRARVEGDIEYFGTRPGGDIGAFDEGISRYIAESGRGDVVVTRTTETIEIVGEWEEA